MMEMPMMEEKSSMPVQKSPADVFYKLACNTKAFTGKELSKETLDAIAKDLGVSAPSEDKEEEGVKEEEAAVVVKAEGKGTPAELLQKLARTLNYK